MAEFERGDIVAYMPRRTRGMSRWYYLEGRVGIVMGGPFPRLDNGVPVESYAVEWVTMDTQGTTGRRSNYHVTLLEKVGHIDLPPEVRDDAV